MKEFLDQTSRNFLMSGETSVDHTMTNHDRWMFIIERCDDIHEVPLYEHKMNEIFRQAYEGAEGEQLVAYGELANLRAEYFHRLLYQSVGMAHVNEYEYMSSYLWSTKLSDKSIAEDDGQKVVHIWLN